MVGVLNKGIPIIKSFAGSLSLAGVAAGAAAAGVGLFLNWLIQHGGKPVDTTAEAIGKLNERVGTGTPVAFGAGTEAIMGYMRVLAPETEQVGKSAEAHVAASTAVEKHAKAMESAKLPSSDLLALFERFKDAAKAKQEQIDKLADIMRNYGVVTAESAMRAAKALDILFISYRQLSDAPDLGNLNGIDFSKLPKAPSPGLPGPGGFEDFVKGGRNIGPEGMMTKEQHAAIVARMKDLGKVGKAAYQQVSTVVTDLSRGITDVIFKGGKLGDMLTNVAKQAAQAITRNLIEGALKKLTDKLFDVGGLMGKVFGGAGGAGGTIFSAAGSAGGSVASAAGSAAGGIGSAAGGIGGAASAASSGIAGIVGAVGSVVSAVSGVIGNFQMMGMNKSLDLIVKHTLQTANDLANLRADAWTREGHLFAKLDDMWKTNLGIYDLLGRSAAVAGGSSVVINLNGGDPKAMLEDITRLLKQYGVIPR